MTDAQPCQSPATAANSSSASITAPEESATKYPWGVTMFATGLAVLLVLAILFTRASFADMMAEFGLEPSKMTLVAISVGWLAINAIHATCLLITNGLLILFLIVEPNSADTCRRIARPLNWASVAISFLFGIIYFGGVFLPLLMLFRGLS